MIHMNKVLGLLALPLGLMIASGCKTSDGTGGAGGTGTTSSTTKATSTTTTKASASVTSTATGMVDCTGILAPGDCATCVEANCCAELAAAADPQTDPDLQACAMASCNTECFPPALEPECGLTLPFTDGSCITISATNACNPVTGESCTGVGSACDFNDAGFECYPAPNDQLLCEPCGSNDGFCAAGMTCTSSGKCGAYCCADSQCGAGKCTKGGFADPNIGVCEDITP